MKNLGIFITIASICLVLPYASNATIIALAVGTIGRYSFLDLVKTIKRNFKNQIFQACFAVIILGFSSYFWSISPIVSVNLAGRLLALFILLNINLFILAKMPQKAFSALQKTAVYTIILTLVFYGVDLTTGGALASIIKGSKQLNLTRIGRGASALSLLMFPTAIMIYNIKSKLGLSFLFVAICSLIIMMLPMRSPVISIVLGGGAFAFVYYLKKPAVITIFSIMIMAIIFAPIISLKLINLETTSNYSHIIPSSWRHRLVIWEYSSKLITAKPILGYGLEASRELGRNSPKKVITTSQNTEHPVFDTALPLHPHNFAIQIWLELGLLGISAFVWLFLAIMNHIISKLDNSKISASLCSMTVAGFFISAFSFGIWQNWWLASLFLTIIFSKISENTSKS